ARGWYDMPDVALPADADEQDRVYIRWMPDRNSELIGAETDYDGLCISDVFVTAEAGALAEEQAVLVASNPEAGATGVSASGSIILNFDKKIKMGTGTATLDGEQLTPVISGKSAVFKYSRLKYNTTYTFTMPEGVLLSRSGNPVAATTITFTTMERTQPEARLYDAVVAQDGSGDYTTLQDAIDNAPAGRAKPWLIFVKNGQYKEHINIPSNKPYLHIIGQTRDKAVILDDKLCGGENGVHVSVGATVVVNANNVFFENITLENSWGHEKQAGPQALALNTQGDRIALNNVALLSYQDTWITTGTSNNRHYIKNSLIEGAVDFIYQSGNVYLDGDTLLINRPSGGYIVAPSHTADVQWGYVFQNNVIKPYPGMNVTDVWLGRPWHNSPKTVFINTQTFVNIPAKGWYNTMGGLPVLWADYNTVDADGNPVDLSQRESYYYYIDSNTGEKVEAFDVKNFLTDEEAAQYTVKNVMGGNDNWQPDLMCEACSAPQPQLRNGRLSWQPVPYAICYVITEGEEVVAFTTDTEYTAATGDDYKVQAVNEYGGLSLYGTASSTTATGVTISDRQEAETPEAFFFANGMQQSRPSRGINIIRMKDGSVKKVVK
ncbi:MAG: Ig-like domain-containing protein, partial [Prevotella sp.]|nr:Ig-like domain-containing protein [Prevotella sp.]